MICLESSEFCHGGRFCWFFKEGALKESPSSQYQRFLDERGNNSNEDVLEKCYRRNLFDLSLSGVENIELSNLIEGEEPTLGDTVGDFADRPECQEETTEPEFIGLIKAALPMLKSAGLLCDLLLFFKLVGRSQFLLSNISLLLFQDVV